MILEKKHTPPNHHIIPCPTVYHASLLSVRVEFKMIFTPLQFLLKIFPNGFKVMHHLAPSPVTYLLSDKSFSDGSTR